MKLIAILLCFSLQRFLNISGIYLNQKLFKIYLNSLNHYFSKKDKWYNFIIMVFPVLFCLMIIRVLFKDQFFHLFNLIFTVMVLFFTIDARDMKYKLLKYVKNLELVNNSKIDEVYIKESSEKKITCNLFAYSFEYLFIGLFWFIIFDIYGSICYLMFSLLEKKLINDENSIEQKQLIYIINSIFHYIPSRILGFSYALIGDFRSGYDYFTKNFLNTNISYKQFVIEAGLASLNKSNTKAETDAVIDIINKTLILWLGSITLIIIGTWI